MRLFRDRSRAGERRFLDVAMLLLKRDKVLYVIHTITCFIHQCTTLFWDAWVRTLACAVRICAIKSVCLWVQGTLKAGMKTLLPPRGNSIVTTQKVKNIAGLLALYMIMNILAVPPIFTNSVSQKVSDWIRALKLTCSLISYSTTGQRRLLPL